MRFQKFVEQHRRPGLRAGDTWRKRLRLIQIRFERERLSEDARLIVKINRVHKLAAMSSDKYFSADRPWLRT
jgi:hypothetical protein